MKTKNYLKLILAELNEKQAYITSKELYLMAEMIIKADRIFIVGAGRSGFIARGFANRLMHLGFTTYFIGEPTTPSIGIGDLLVIGSGSGSTGSLVAMAQMAKKSGGNLATITIFPDAAIGQLADSIVRIPGQTPKNSCTTEHQSFQPLGNLFEQLSWLVYDSVILILKEQLNITEDEMFSHHANLE